MAAPIKEWLIPDFFEQLMTTIKSSCTLAYSIIVIFKVL